MKINKLLQLLRDNPMNRAEGEQIIRSEVAADVAHLYVYDVIDSFWGASAAALVSALAAVGDKPVHLHINSPGGDVFEARAMAAAIVAHAGPITAQIDGVCASAATYLALACGEVRMTQGGLFMVHNSWTLAMGDCTELRSTADLLQKIDGTIAADYTRKTGASADQVTAWMNAETWFTADEALAAKFVDAVDPNTKGGEQAKWNLSAYANAPAVEEPKPDLAEQISQQLQLNRNRMRLFQI